MNKKKKLLIFVSTVVLSIAVCAGFFGSHVREARGVTTISQYQENIKKLEQQKANNEKQQKQLQRGVTDTKNILSDLENDKSNLSQYIEELDMAYMDIVGNIEELENLIESKKTEIAEVNAELEAAEQQEADQYEAMSLRMKYFYEQSGTFYLELLLDATSFGDLLNRIEYMEQVVEYDHNMLVEYRNTISYIDSCRTLLEEEKTVLIKAEEQLEGERSALETLMAAKQKELDKYEQDINDKEALMKAYLQEIEDQKNELAVIEAAIEASQAELNRLRSFGSYDGSPFVWPCPKYTYISSEYGWRTHPILKVRKFHNGVDMAAPYGSDIKAACNGQVIKAAYDRSMGNYVMIDHGSGLYTIYMHASKLLVKEGDCVYGGDVIAKVGMTGSATGNHLHFGVRVNGDYTTPWDYLPTGYKK